MTFTDPEPRKAEPVPSPTHRERQFMQHLRGAGWVKADNLALSPRVIAGLVAKGWIDVRGVARETCYRLTDKGLAAKITPVRIYY
jgi:hypothetical protein